MTLRGDIWIDVETSTETLTASGILTNYMSLGARVEAEGDVAKASRSKDLQNE